MPSFHFMANALAKTLKSAAGESVIYHRDDLNGSFSVPITAVRGRSDMSTEDGSLVLQVQTVDWIVEACDLKLNGNVVLPARDDYITIDGSADRYQVFEVPYRPSDPAGRMLRIHTTQTV